MGIRQRLNRLEDSAFPEHADCIYRSPEQMDAYVQKLHDLGFDVVDQIDDIEESLYIHQVGGTKQLATDREIYIVSELIDCGYLNPWARDYFRRMDPAEQPEREAWLFSKREQHRRMRKAQGAWREWARRSQHGRYPIPDHIEAMLKEAGY